MSDRTIAGLFVGHLAALIHHSVPLGIAWGFFSFFATWFCEWWMERETCDDLDDY